MIYVPNRRKAFQAAAGGGLLTGLNHWWDLGADLNDSIGGQNFTNNGGAGGTTEETSTAPDGGSSRDFVLNDYLSIAAGGVWNSGSATTFAIWTYLDTTGNAAVYGHNAPNGYSLGQYLASTANFRWWFDAGFNGDAPTTGAYQNWVSVIVTSNGPGTGGDSVYFNNVLKDTATNGWEPGSAIFYLGASQTGAPQFVGNMCSAGEWDHVFSADERAAFHNSGVNLRYADL
jgi:hypothetical protein